MSLAGRFPIDKWNFKSESILQNLPAEEYNYLRLRMVEQEFKKNEVLFREGSIPHGIFFIKQGKVKKYQVGRSGKEQIFYVANSGELVGYHAVLTNERYPDSAATLENSIIAFISKEDFLSTLESSTILPQRLLKILSHEFTVLINSISILAHRSVRERVAIVLIVLREKFKDEAAPGSEVVINISRSDLANMVGAGEENVIRFLKEFKTCGILDTQGRKIVIHNVSKLIELSGYGDLR